MNINNKTCVVTGAGKGIGKSIATAFFQNGYKTIIADIDEETGEKTAKELDPDEKNCIFIPANVCDEDSMKTLAKTAKNRFGAIDTIIVNAGISELVGFEDLSLENWEKVLKINLTGSFLTIKAFIPEMKVRKSGNIIFITSGSAFTGSGGGAHYSSSKSGQHGLMRAIAREYGPEGIRINAIAPRTIETDILTHLYPPGTESRENLTNKIPLKRVGLPEDIANMAIFLASEKSSYIHGQIMLIDGGRTYSG